MWFFMIFLRYRIHSWSCGFLSFHNTIQFLFLEFFSDAFGFCTNQRSCFPFARGPMLSFAGHGGRHISLFFSSRSWWCLCIPRHPDQKNNSLSNLCSVEFRFLDCRFFFFLFFGAAFPILTTLQGHTWSGRVVVWIFGSLIPDHMYRFGGVSFNKVNFMNPVHESDNLLSSSTFQ